MHTEVFIDDTRDVVYTCFKILQRILKANDKEVWEKRQETKLQCRCCTHKEPGRLLLSPVLVTFSIARALGRDLTFLHVLGKCSTISYTDSLLFTF
jgi:hypothetical protein